MHNTVKFFNAKYITVHNNHGYSYKLHHAWYHNTMDTNSLFEVKSSMKADTLLDQHCIHIDTMEYHSF